MSAVAAIVAYALHEAVRRRVFLVVLVLTIAFLSLFWLGTRKIFHETGFVAPPPGVDVETLVGGTVFGLAMFATLFLGTVLAVFLTLGTVHGDAERGILQPLVVRPVGRATFVVSRFLAAASLCGLYVAAVYGVSLLIVRTEGGWVPDRIVGPALELAVAIATLTALSLLGSVFLSATANGIAVFMAFGAGLVAGLLGQIGEALGSETLRDVARDASWLLPFEALYQDALHRITADSAGLTEFAIRLGPFGGAELGGPWLLPWTFAYLAIVLGAAVLAFERRDL